MGVMPSRASAAAGSLVVSPVCNVMTSVGCQRLTGTRRKGRSVGGSARQRPTSAVFRRADLSGRQRFRSFTAGRRTHVDGHNQSCTSVAIRPLPFSGLRWVCGLADPSAMRQAGAEGRCHHARNARPRQVQRLEPGGRRLRGSAGPSALTFPSLLTQDAEVSSDQPCPG